MRFNINGIIKSVTKNPVQLLLIGAAFGVGFLIAKKMVASNIPPMPANVDNGPTPVVPYDNVEYRRQFEGIPGWQYNTPDSYTTPTVENMEGNAVRPEVMNAYYDNVFDGDSDGGSISMYNNDGSYVYDEPIYYDDENYYVPA